MRGVWGRDARTVKRAPRRVLALLSRPMGFDLSMVRKPPSVDERELPNSNGIPGNYRFTTWGMQMTLGALEWADAIYYGRAPALPALDVGGLDEEGVVAALAALVAPGEGSAGPAPSAEALDLARRHLRACEDVLTRSSLCDGRVGAYKFRSNDGWLVTPEECEVLDARLRASATMIARDMFTDAGLTADEGLRWVLGFARYNAVAAAYGGYRVY